MKLKKILALVLCTAMVLSAMGTVAFAEGTTVATVNGTPYPTIQEAINAAGEGDTVTIAAGEYGGFNISNKKITIQGTMSDEGELLTTIKGGNPAITGHHFDGTIKNLKVVDAWKVMYAEPAGNVTIDNVYVTGATYGFHLVAYTTGINWTIQNSYMDLSWANSLGAYNGGYADIIIKNNKFDSTDPYYPDYGALAVNTFSPSTTVEGNVFGKGTKIYIDADAVTDTSGINIGANYYADGVENAFADDSDGVKVDIDTFYSDITENGELTGLVDTAKTYIAHVKNENGTVTYYTDIISALKAIEKDSVVNLLADVSYEGKWDARYTGAKIGVPFTFNGNGHTLKFTNEINDGFNYLAAFRVEADATFNDLTIDMSEAVSVFQNRFSVISTNGCDLTVDGCTFIGSTTYTSARAIIFGEGGKVEDAAEISVTNSKFINWKYGVVDNMNRADVAKSVEIFDSEFENAGIKISASEDVVLTNNEVTGAYVDVVSYSDTNELSVVATGNTLEAAANGKSNFIVAKEIETDDDFVFDAAATIGNKYYATLKAAFAVAEDGDTITLLEDITLNESITNSKDITLDLNGKTITGEDNSNKSFGLINNKADLTITGNGTITLVASVESGWNRYSSVISNNPGGKLVVENGTIEHLGGTSMAYAIDNLTNGKGTYAETIINGGNIISTYRAVRQFLNGVEAQNILKVNGGAITGANKSIWMQDPSANANSGKLTVTDGATLNGDVYLSVTAGSTEWPVDVSIAEAALAGESAVLSANVPAGYDVIRTAKGYEVTTKEAEQADSISVVYEEASATEGEKVYNIVVKANEGDVINELASVDLSFVYTTDPVTGGAIDFTVAPAEEFAMTRYENTNRYLFNYNGVGDNYEGTANAIVIGTITVTGYGSYTIATDNSDAAKATNVVHATTVHDNLVDSYTVAGAEDDDATTGALDINAGIDDGEIAVPTRTLKITIDFPNAIEANVAAYQDMKVEITGVFDGVNKTVTYELGEVMEDGSYVVEDANLVLNNAYTVTVSGAGYRTARYTVTMTEDKALRFWNNVMDEAQVVEIGKDSSAVEVTFLAGDIVKDNNINIYDLSAVVSYFGSVSTTENGYAKYDLNRDGVIDSKDVAYVLVSWNN